MSFENFPYTNFHELNLDWLIQKVKEAYRPDNPPENIVLSVNGESGDVILYKNAIVRFPDIEDDTWNIEAIPLEVSWKDGEVGYDTEFIKNIASEIC